MSALGRGDISGIRNAVHRYVVLPQVPDEPLAPRFQTVCRSWNTHKFTAVNLVGMPRPVYKILCEPTCRHSHVCMRCGNGGHPAAHCSAPEHECSPSALARLGPRAPGA